MTCEEFRRLRDKNPLECTRAERMASLSHVRKCRSCRRWWNACLAEMRAGGATLTQAEQIELVRTRQSDNLDPEV